MNWLSLGLLAVGVVPQIAVGEAGRVEMFPLAEVELLDGPLRHAVEVNRATLLRHDADRLLAPFLLEAGLKPKAPKYPNWENTGLDGHTGGHYLSGLANTAAALDDDACRERLAYAVAELARCQEASGDGFVGGTPGSRELWEQVACGDIRAGGFSLNDRWVPLYNLHKTFAGLRDAYRVGGVEQAKDVLVRLADWCDTLVANLDDAQMQTMLQSEHGGMNEVLADVSVITGDEKYLRLAERFNHRWLLDPLAAGKDQLSGIHANTQVPKVVGFQKIASLNGDQRLHDAALKFWEIVVGHRTIAIGGNSISEFFPAPSQSIRWIEQREGPETCNTYNMMRLSEELFAVSPEARFADFYERAVYNHALSAQHPEHGGYVYFTPARPRHYRVYSQPEVCFWCCVASGMENQSRYGQFLYAHDPESLYVNLYAPSKLHWREKGVGVHQATRFPDEERTSLTFSVEKPVTISLRLRHPSWVPAGDFKVTINGEAQIIDSKPSSYVELKREWREGDRVDVELPMHTVAEPLPYLDDYVALVHGPIVLAAKTGTEDLDGLIADEARMAHVAAGPLEPTNEAPMLIGAAEEVTQQLRPVAGKPLTFTLADAIRPDAFDGIELTPFFRVHDARYMLYWRQLTEAGYAAALAAAEAAERAQLALDRATIDHVLPGEQQSEVGHQFRDEQSETGVWLSRRYRHGSGWFEYVLNAGDNRDATLRVTYFGSDQRRFTINVNGKELADVDFDAPKPGEFVEIDYPVPAEMIETADDGALAVRFAAKPGSMAGGVFDVRLIDPAKLKESD
ncbi:Non-reducing end beta-L-arabinofuranosidase [Botrimarina colliarenosi]|uniref:Non-reducing end beta-L-arabinofuranosidase n=1 Tax=Botrimarina colliarenosi TaxID=2528001 RepID=A0A5C6APG3_9BACT|nr:glycoside hydrolase family 127 protein [Botrimarina colliarenosi]TWU00064.1 Non-reducing end beta-L-arabinofuranosidase [Botrimarina colliarenosi]